MWKKSRPIEGLQEKAVSWMLLPALLFVTVEAQAFSRGDILVSAVRIGQGESATFAVRTGKDFEPHLHFGMRVNGARVDPMQIIVLSEQMERP